MPVAPWVAEWAARAGLRYEAEPDERWMRAWEPYTTLRVPIRYEHMLEATGASGSITVARLVTLVPGAPSPTPREVEASAWIAIAQDVRVTGAAATTSDPSRAFAESAELIATPRRATGDGAFDRSFATFSHDAADATRIFHGSVRRLLLSWRTPLHVETRPGGFILAPVALGADPASLDWLLRAVTLFGEKVSKPASA